MFTLSLHSTHSPPINLYICISIPIIHVCIHIYVCMYRYDKGLNHSQKCSEFTHDFILMDHSQWYCGDHMQCGGLKPCWLHANTSTLTSVLSLITPK